LQPNTKKLYIGSNQGIYSANFNPINNSITEITNDPIIKGQVWDLIAYDGQLFCGNNDETYQILPSKKILSYAHGGMTIAKGVLHNKDVLVQGTYSDVCIYTRNGNNWQFNSIIKNFIHPIKSIEIDYQGRIWAAHMHQGLFLIKLADDLKTTQTIEKFDYFENQNLKQINVSKINNRVVFSDNSQFYIYNDIDKKIVPFNDLNNALGKFKSAYKVVMQSPSNYWFIRKDEAALFYITETSTILKDRVQFSLFQNQIVDNFQNIFPISDDKAFFTLENGLILYSSNHSKPFKTKKVDMFFSEIAILDKNLEIKEYTPVLTNKNSISLPYTKNRIKFSLSYPDFTHLNDLVFSYLLTGQNNKLSEVSQNNSIEYAYLAPGKYTFTAQVMNNNNELLATKKYEFQIRPPYYWNTYSKIFYALLIGVLLYLLLHYAKKREESKQQKLFEETEQNQKRELEKREQEIGKLKAEKLEAELTLKSKELATSTMTIIKKNEVVNRIKEELIITKQQIGTQFPNKYYDKIIKLLDENISSDDDWGIFQSNFDRIHDSFFRNLHTKYPNLTSNDLRFCAFFRLNLSTKDIANLMNISIKGVEVARYRIRKKLLIPSEKNIAEFFIEFK
jgi:DNA-binding CsgD family transcriptional regulator